MGPVLRLILSSIMYILFASILFSYAYSMDETPQLVKMGNEKPMLNYGDASAQGEKDVVDEATKQLAKVENEKPASAQEEKDVVDEAPKFFKMPDEKPMLNYGGESNA